MRDLLPEIAAWQEDGKRVALATVVAAWGSAPRPVGSKMALTDAGDIAGSVSGGCVEGAVFEEGQTVIASGAPKLVEYGVSQDEAWAIGLPCGGKIAVYIEALAAGDGVFKALSLALREDRLAALATVVGGPAPFLGRRLLLGADGAVVDGAVVDGAVAGSLADPRLEAEIRRRALTRFADLSCERFALEIEGASLDVFLEVLAPRKKLVIIGAVHVAIPLVRFARELGFRTHVIDPRSAFATPERFPHADELTTEWPDEALERLGLDESTYLVLLSHDLKLDVPALERALPSPVRYIGALGSKKTHQKRLAALAETGIDAALASRIHNPIGLPLGGRRAEEMAVSILAELVAVSHGIDYRPPPAGDAERG